MKCDIHNENAGHNSQETWFNVIVPALLCIYLCNYYYLYQHRLCKRFLTLILTSKIWWLLKTENIDTGLSVDVGNKIKNNTLCKNPESQKWENLLNSWCHTCDVKYSTPWHYNVQQGIMHSCFVWTEIIWLFVSMFNVSITSHHVWEVVTPLKIFKMTDLFYTFQGGGG